MIRWVLNSSPIITLGRLEHLSIIPSLCEEIIIPGEVAEEVKSGPVDDFASKWLQNEGKIYVKPFLPIPSTVAAWDLGKGESAVLAWGYQHRDWEIVVDDGAARKCARALEIKFLGTVGVILRAKKYMVIEQATPLLHALQIHGFRIAPSVVKKTIELAIEE